MFFIVLCIFPVVIAYLLSLADTNPAVVNFPPLRELPLDIKKLENVELFFENDPTFKGIYTNINQYRDTFES